MRGLLLIIAFSFSIHLCAQDEVPSKSEMQTQMKKAITDAKKQWDDVKLRLAKAKAKNEDPESIKQLEDQVTMLDNMINQLEGVNPFANSEQKKLPLKNIEPAFVSPFTPIKLRSPAVAPTEAQAKDQLLWFKGKKIDANTLITTNGTLVHYSPNNYKLTIQPDKNKDTTYYPLVAALSQLSAGRKEFITEVDKDPNSFFFFPLINTGYREFNSIRDQYYDLAKNSQDISPPQNYGNLEALQQQLINYMNTLYPNPNVLQLPIRPNIFCSCDFDAAYQVYESEFKDWKEKFQDGKLLKMVKGVEAIEEQLLINRAYENIPDNLEGTIDNAMVLLVMRHKLKLTSLRQQYESKNIEVEDALTYAITIANNYILTYGSTAFDQLDIEIKALTKERDLAKKLIFSSLFKDVIEEKKAKRDFEGVLNHSVYVDHETNKELLDKNYIRNIQPWVRVIHDFNRFSLSIKMEFEYQNVVKTADGNEDILMIATGNLESDKITVSLGVEDCKIIFFIESVNNKNRHTSGEEFKIPMNITGGMKDYTKDKSPPFRYTGPPTMRLLFPSFRLNFCGNNSEVKMENISYLPSDLKRHEHDDFGKMYTTDMFDYANKMLVEVKKTQVNVNQLIQSSIQGLNMAGSSNMSQSFGNPVLDEMNAEYQGDKKRRDLLYQAGHATQGQKVIVDLGVIDPKGSPTLIKKQVDLADPNDPDRGIAIFMRHGYLTIEMLHTPK
ncbi:MAG: hypothetical protein ABIW38_02275 [Ferruginibacter sp.]